MDGAPTVRHPEEGLPCAMSYRFGRFELQVDERRLLKDGSEVPLRPQVLDVLAALADRAGHLVTKDELFERVWGRVIVEENTLQAHVSALRKVLGPQVIATVSGRGYRMVVEVDRTDGLQPSVAIPKHNLPNLVSSFIGRETEIAQVKRLLASTRLLTLAGAGGCGKTRIALKIADEVLPHYADGVWLAELAPLGDATLLPRTVANAIGIKEQGGKDPAESLAEWLGARHSLVVLDNAEHVLESCARLVDLLLRRCARVTILVTSRERLGMDGELTYRVPSLTVPGATAGGVEETLSSEAARLFIERARLHSPEIQISPRDAAALASVCRRLDGIALAIELAAPRLRAMSLTELSQRIADRFDILTEGSRTALPRHRTLRSLIDWSYELLGDTEKALLQRTSVFAGGWTLEAAEHVCIGAGIDRVDVLDRLASLVDKSLLSADTQGDETRYGMLETVRHYALDRLRESGDEGTVRGRHLDYYLSLAERLDELRADSERQIWLERLDSELDNLRAALAWCEADAKRAAKGLLLAGRLYWLWLRKAHSGEGRGWIARLLAVAPGGDEGEAHARAYFASATMAFNLSDIPAAEAHHRAALAIWTNVADRRQVLRCLGSLGNVVYCQGGLESACDLYEQALVIARELSDRRSIAVGLTNLGIAVYGMGDLGKAATLLEQGVAAGREAGSWIAVEALGNLGRVRHFQGDTQNAKTLLTEALKLQRELGDGRNTALILGALGIAAHDEKDVETAKSHLTEALAITQEIGDRTGFEATLLAFGGVAADFASPSIAARLWGFAEGIREEVNFPISPPERARYERHVAAARAALNDDAAFDRAWTEGRSWTIDEAVRCAMEV